MEFFKKIGFIITFQLSIDYSEYIKDLVSKCFLKQSSTIVKLAWASANHSYTAQFQMFQDVFPKITSQNEGLLQTCSRFKHFWLFKAVFGAEEKLFSDN